MGSEMCIRDRYKFQRCEYKTMESAAKGQDVLQKNCFADGHTAAERTNGPVGAVVPA